ncbi:MAG: 50S ribosomal protein L6, partial [Okeania sp. SIO3B3]|nr:50S ribosomal protein L6 [Okeania sp. SIO3B3]
MSRIGKLPIKIPNKVTITIDGQKVTVKGPKGELSRVISPEIAVEQQEDTIVVKPKTETRRARQQYGLSRTLVANMVEGVSFGYA